MPTLLILNPNTTEAITALLARHAERRSPQGWTLRAATARFGAAYITGPVAMAVASHAVLEAWATDVEQYGTPDVALLGCFGDPGLEALSAVAPCPVVGLASAAMRAAARHGRFAVVTGGAGWVPVLERLAHGLGLGAALAGVQAVDRSGGELARDPAAARSILQDACRQALVRWPDAQALLLGGAGLAGLAAPVADGLPVPVLDNVDLGLEAAFAAAHAPVPRPPPEPGPWRALSTELARRLASQSLDP